MLGYRDPESQVFIESWFAKLRKRCAWLHAFETIDEAETMPSETYRPKRPELATSAGSSA